jgi:hypothetical protein
VNEHNGRGYETRDTVVVVATNSNGKGCCSAGKEVGNGGTPAISVQTIGIPTTLKSSNSRKNSGAVASNPFLEPSKRQSSVDMKGLCDLYFWFFTLDLSWIKKKKDADTIQF